MDCRKILTSEELATLRAGFREEHMLAGARESLIQAFPPAENWVGSLLDQIFTDTEDGLNDRYRELAVISFMAARGRKELGIHLYWGLMLGLTEAELADALMVAGVYGGVPLWFTGIGTLEKVLMALKECVRNGVTGTMEITPVVGQL